MRTSLATQAQQYSEVLTTFLDTLPDLDLTTITPARTALVCVDLIEGFARQGVLASPRVASIIPHVVTLIEKLDVLGVPHNHMMFIQDAHPKNAQEFNAYPPHCIIGTPEAEAVAELKNLTNWPYYQHCTKNSIASHTSPVFNMWLEEVQASTFIVVGDVTDLCLYTLALHLQVHNIAHDLKQRVIVPENCVQTWDAPDHPGDLYHGMFLHQLARNGVDVVARAY